MKAQFSRISYKSDRHYSGVYQQQGRMITDADWNELMAVVIERQRYANRVSIDSGVPAGLNVASDGTGESIVGVLNVEDNRSASGVVDIKTTLQWGDLVVDGIYAEVMSKDPLTSDFDYSNQKLFPDAPVLPVSGNVTFYADVWERLVISLQDENIRDAALHGADTCVRTQVMAQIKYTEAAEKITDKSFNPENGNAVFNLQRVANIASKDDPCLDQSSIAKDLGNYLFRLEIHEVQGDAGSPDKLTLKWSSENAAESHLTGKETAEFKSGNWVYEFYDDSTEQNLGVHLLPVDKMSDVKRSSLKIDDDNYVVDETFKYVRRWDGYCILQRSGQEWSIVSGRHFGGRIPEDINAEFTAGTLTIEFGELNLTLECKEKSFVSGDYWFALLRETQEPDNEPDVLSPLPVGIVHHYLKLGDVDVAVPDEITSLNLKDVRQLSFPSLTDITADRVGYDASIVSSRWDDINDEDIPQPETVQDAIDHLASNLEASDIKYAFSECDISDGVPSFKSLIEEYIKNKFTKNGITKVKIEDLWDAILCELDAAKVPYNPNFKIDRWADINDYLIIKNNIAQEQIFKLVESREVLYSMIEFDISLSVAMDKDGNVWTAFSWVDNGDYKTLLMKFDSQYQRILTVNYDFIITDMVVDNNQNGNIYIVGVYTKAGELDLPETIQDSIIFAAIKNDASMFKVKGFTGNIYRKGLSIALDDAGDIIISGNFRGKIIFNDEGVTLTNPSQSDRSIFLIKFNSDHEYILSANYASSSDARVYSTAVDNENNIILIGVFTNDIRFYEQKLTNVSNDNDGSVVDNFIVKLNTENETMLWSDQFRNTPGDVDEAVDIVIDSSKNMYLAFREDRSVRVMKYVPGNMSGYSQEWSNQYDMTGQLTGIDLGLDKDENIIINGSFYGSINFGGNDLITLGGTFPDDTYLVSFDQAGNHRWSIKKGGEIRTDLGSGVIQDSNGNILLTGMEINWKTEKDGFGYDINVVDLNAVMSVFTTDEESLPFTVQQAIDDLIENLESSDIRYNLPGCGENDSVRDLLPSIKDRPETLALKINDILNALLCELDANTIPYNRNANAGSLIDGFINKDRAEKMDGPLTIDDDADPANPDPQNYKQILLDVKGAGQFNGFNLKYPSGATGSESTPLDGWVLTLEDATTGKGVWKQSSPEGWTINGNNVYAEIGGNINVKIGIGTDQPEYSLHINQSVQNGLSIGTGGDSGRIWTEYKDSGPNLIFYDLDDVGGIIRFRESPNAKDPIDIINENNPEYEALISGKRGNIGIGTVSPENKLTVSGGDISLSMNSHRSGKLRMWQEANNGDEFVSHAIGTESYHNVYGAGSSYKNSIGHKFYCGGGELIAQIGYGGANKTSKRLDSYFSGNVGFGTQPGDTRLKVAGDLELLSPSPTLFLTATDELSARIHFRDYQAVSSQSFDIYFNASDEDLYFSSDEKEVMKLTNDGLIYFTPKNIDPKNSPHPPLSGSQLVIGWNRTGGRGETVFYQHGGAGWKSGFDFWSERNGKAKMRLASIEDTGNLNIAGGFGSLSDKREKTNIQPIVDSIEKILALSGVYYEWKNKDIRDSETHIGLIAQDVKKVLPEIVISDEDENETLSLQYNGVIPVLIEAIKDQQKIIYDLKKRVELLEKS